MIFCQNLLTQSYLIHLTSEISHIQVKKPDFWNSSLFFVYTPQQGVLKRPFQMFSSVPILKSRFLRDYIRGRW